MRSHIDQAQQNLQATAARLLGLGLEKVAATVGWSIGNKKNGEAGDFMYKNNERCLIHLRKLRVPTLIFIN
jgi:hypothetical protein